MFLQADVMGETVPAGGFQGSVHSVFETLVNLRIADSRSLVALYLSPATNLPQGIRLRAGAAFSTRRCAPGQPVWRSGDMLSLPAAGWQIDLSAARVWRCDWAGLHIDLDHPSAQAAWLEVARLLGESSAAAAGVPVVQVAAAVNARLEAGLNSLRQAAAAFDVPAVQAAVAALAGLGPGLTPAGDDMLLGFAAGLRASAGAGQQRLAFTRAFEHSLRAAAARTNDISRTYLLQAARGQFSSSLMDLLWAIACSGSSGFSSNRGGQGLRPAAQQVLQTGHSSGRDTTAGLLASLSAWSPHLR